MRKEQRNLRVLLFMVFVGGLFLLGYYTTDKGEESLDKVSDYLDNKKASESRNEPTSIEEEFFTPPTSYTPPTTQPNVKKIPESIGGFDADESPDEKYIILFFHLKDENNNFMASDGEAHITIKQERGDLIYQKTHRVYKHLFADYTSKYTDNIITGYEIKIPKYNLVKTYESFGVAYLEFEIPEGKFTELETSVYGLPTLSDNQIQEIQSSKYETSAQIVEKSIRKDGLEVTLHSVGWYTHQDFSGEEEFFRADFTVNNYGRDESRLSTHDSYLIADRTQYDKSYNSDLDAFDLKKGVERTGFILFEDVPKDISGKITISAGSTRVEDDFDEIDFSFSVNLE